MWRSCENNDIVRPLGQYGAVVLCGGSSRRMGRDKVWLDCNGQTMLQLVVRAVDEAVAPVAVAAAPGQPLPDLPDHVTVLRDRRKRAGPLEGLLTALLWATETGLDAVFVTGCDLPMIKPAVVRLVLDRLGDNDVAICRLGSKLQPLLAAYKTHLIGEVHALLAASRVSLMELVNRVKAATVDEADIRRVDPELQCLWNLNTPEQYADFLRVFGSRQE